MANKHSPFLYFRLLIVAVLIISLLQGCASSNDSNSKGRNSPGAAKSSTITIGYQTPTAQTWGALIIKHEKLFEKYLKELAPNDEVQVEWFD